MTRKLSKICTLILLMFVCRPSDSFGWCEKPEPAFTFSPKCYDQTDDKYYIAYDKEITINADAPPYHESFDYDFRGSECDEGSICPGIDLINGLRKFKWYFGDGNIYWETCSIHSDGEFDAKTKHTYLSTGSKTLTLMVYDVDGTCDNHCPPGWGDQAAGLGKSIVVVRANLVVAGCPESTEESEGGFLALNDDDDNDNDIADRLDDIIPGWDDDMSSLWLSLSPSLSKGEVQLTASSTKIKVWEEPAKVTEVNLPKTWDLSTESLPTDPYCVEGYLASSSLRDIELKFSYIRNGCIVHSDKVKMTVIDVDYAEDTNQKYGYDKYTDTQSDIPSFYPYKSVKVGDTDTAYANILSGGSSMASEVYFASSNTTYVTVSPSQASSTHEQVTFTGVSEGFAVGVPTLHDPNIHGIDAAWLGVESYNQDPYSVAVRVVHETGGYTSTDPYTAPQLQTYLNEKTYNQAVVNWSVTKLPDMTVNFDLNSDGYLDVSSWTTAEMDVIINNCKDPLYEYNIFIVNNPSRSICGIMGFPPNVYGFVHPDHCSSCVENTTAHELGHGAFGLTHPDDAGDNDINNLMHSTASCPERLRRGQWVITQGYK